MIEPKKKGPIELPFDEAPSVAAHSVCTNYTAILQSLQEEIERKFTGKREQGDLLAAVYSVLGMKSRTQRVLECGTFLEFKVSHEKAKLQHANFCKDRLCPMCNWRRSLKIFSQMSKVMNAMQGYEFLFLTLTVRNCSADELPQTVQALYDGWRYLYHKNKEFRSVIEGTFRSLEVTRNKKDGSYHPHLHCILAVKPSYFKKGYITQKRWSELWQQACGLDYDPIVHIEKVKDTGSGISDAVAEASKYPTKSSDFLDGHDVKRSAEYAASFLEALAGRRLCGWTGIFAEIRKQLNLDDCENGDLVVTDDDVIREDVACMIVRYSWRAGAYVRM